MEKPRIWQMPMTRRTFVGLAIVGSENRSHLALAQETYNQAYWDAITADLNKHGKSTLDLHEGDEAKLFFGIVANDYSQKLSLPVHPKITIDSAVGSDNSNWTVAGHTDHTQFGFTLKPDDQHQGSIIMATYHSTAGGIQRLAIDHYVTDFASNINLNTMAFLQEMGVPTNSVEIYLTPGELEMVMSK